ncbi:hypothetical protein HYH03_007333 [Edaphochlamys debaryana]|uniref:J domain-containing protein n=1 Tax=Edaphochlamys debaryana TaxID=47281 RepID=A0A835Y0V4_9CHLO|nr:hypothetical protein HYH03_007333 [Edaphochlamys debaryana]|eukprot:KAG2494567.1 hypothetical protein HYH03_007333 [Edaphochlamys debaryana]
MWPASGRRLAHSARRPVRRAACSSVSVVAFRNSAEPSNLASPPSPSVRNLGAGEHISVHVDYYRLLRVARISGPEKVRKEYESLMNQPAATTFTADTLFSRAVLLRAAYETLTDEELRRSYDAKLAAGHTALRVSQQDLPGALVVLQEIGEYQLVLDLGASWLQLNARQPDAADVAAAMALAYCDRASEVLNAVESASSTPTPASSSAASTAATDAEGAEQPHPEARPSGRTAGTLDKNTEGGLMAACDDLDAALAKLRRYGVAQQLQGQLVAGLRDLAPDYACELASLPLGTESAQRRAKGVHLMRGVLRASAAATAPPGSSVASGRGGPEPGDLDLAGDEDAARAVAAAKKVLKRSRDVLTCSEQVSLLPDTLRALGPKPPADVLYDSALALLVDGFRSGHPHAILRADRLLASVAARAAAAAAATREQRELAAAAAARRAQYGGPAAASGPGAYHYNDGSEDGMPPGDSEAEHAGGVALERAVCAVLLGDYAEAMRGLGLEPKGKSLARPKAGPKAAAVKADEQLKAFVLSNSPQGAADMRPGLRALAARWLEGVGLASFRDTAGSPVPPLERSWLSEPRVTVYLAVYSICRLKPVLAAAHFLCNLLPTLLAFFASLSVKMAASSLLAANRAQRVTMAVAAAAAPAPRPTAVSGRKPAGVKTQVSAGAAVGAAAATSAGRNLRSSIGDGPAGSRPPSPTASASFEEDEANVPSAAPADVRSRFAAGKAAAAAAAATTSPAAASSSAPAGSPLGSRQPTARPLRAAGAAAPAAASSAGAPAATASVDEEDRSTAAGQDMDEKELRAYLAGLEKAMWDSELPSQRRGLSPAVMWLMGAAALVAALMAAMFRRSAEPTPAMAPTAALTTTVVTQEAGKGGFFGRRR